MKRTADTDSAYRHRGFDRTSDTDSAYRSRSSDRTGRGRKKRTVGSAVWRGVIFGMVLCLLAELGTALGIPVVSCSKSVAKRISSVIPQESIEQVQNLIYRIAFGWTADSLPVCGCLFAAAAGAEEGAGDASVSGFAAGLWQVVTDQTVIGDASAIKNDVAKSVIEENAAGNGDSRNDGNGGETGNDRNSEDGGDDGNGGDAGNNGSGGESGNNGNGEGSGDNGNGVEVGNDKNGGESGNDGSGGESGNNGNGEGSEDNGNGVEVGNDKNEGEAGSDGNDADSGNDGSNGDNGNESEENEDDGTVSGAEKTEGGDSGEDGKGGEDAGGETGADTFLMPTATGTVYTAETLTYSFLSSNFYNISSSTIVYESELNGSLLEVPLTLSEITEEPQILIYHTHSHEFFADSDTSDLETGIVGVGNYLTELLEGYGYSVLHLTDQFDYVDGVLDRSKAYTYAGTRLKEVLAEYPTIEVMIDLHRDGVDDGLHLVTEINGKSTAMIMFFNGMSRTTSGNISYLPNTNLKANLAFSLQLKVKAEAYYPGFTRKNYVKPYRYNLHLLEKALLIEAGAQTNTFEEVKNAMEPLAVLLHIQLSGLE